MDIRFAGEDRDIDQPLLDAADIAPTDPIRIRVQPAVYIAGQGYSSWKRLTWALRFSADGGPSIEQAKAFRLALTAFFSLLGRLGVAKLADLLMRLDRETAAETELAPHDAADGSAVAE